MKSKSKIFFSLFLLLICKISFAQVKDSLPKKSKTIYNGDTIRLYTLPDVYVYGALDPTTVDNMQKYYKLRRDIIRAYPYSKLASATLKSINDSLSRITSKRERKKYIKSTEKEMKAKFEDELKKMTVNQGKILIKLIDRETGSTSYELVKEYRGFFEAMLWQTTARFFGASMKTTYDPEGEDKVIESIVEAIEKGEIPVAKK
ncbi:MAG TPA: DUF4294 domain-containing protein [Bacteroidia bacterium]|nr:DUF4294 domain-containing protein [Bacteroidia bacterium]